MNIGSFDYGEYVLIYLDEQQIFKKETAKPCLYISDDFNCPGYSWSSSAQFSEPEYLDYYNPTHTKTTISINIQNNLDENQDNQSFLIRDFRIYIQKCHFSCLQCNGPKENQCTSCYQGINP